ncbi:hypothetical protein Patl1_25731 [Pistacia atlantica]|uniref:Uncharacterized protein n=1 Tax=Pistacia atlantica TaxID=434234 RepID=A0ACC1B264_9ROSI|nr:hypothetical protein Patl1_25731 [Pistacia atlantica]
MNGHNHVPLEVSKDKLINMESMDQSIERDARPQTKVIPKVHQAQGDLPQSPGILETRLGARASKRIELAKERLCCYELSEEGLKKPSSKLYESLKKLAERPKEMERSLSSMKKFKNLPPHRKLQQGNNMLAKVYEEAELIKKSSEEKIKKLKEEIDVLKVELPSSSREKLIGLSAKPCKKSKGLQFDLKDTQKELNTLKVELLQVLKTCAKLKADVDPSIELKDVSADEIETSTAIEVIADKLKTDLIVKVTPVNEAADEQLTLGLFCSKSSNTFKSLTWSSSYDDDLFLETTSSYRNLSRVPIVEEYLNPPRCVDFDFYLSHAGCPLSLSSSNVAFPKGFFKLQMDRLLKLKTAIFHNTFSILEAQAF